MIGVILAAGEGRRLRPLTEALPKTLLGVDGGVTILDIALRNLAEVGITDIAVVTGFAADRIAERVADLQRRYGVALELIHNDRATVWNNAYSLWLAREVMARGALVVNGDTVHPASVERLLLAEGGGDIVLAVDDVKPLGAEEMKVVLADGRLQRISKQLQPADAAGEYIGLTYIPGSVVGLLADALEATWRRDTTLYYEDGYQRYVDSGEIIRSVPIGTVPWVEVDDHNDLERAKEVACRY